VCFLFDVHVQFIFALSMVGGLGSMFSGPTMFFLGRWTVLPCVAEAVVLELSSLQPHNYFSPSQSRFPPSLLRFHPLSSFSLGYVASLSSPCTAAHCPTSCPPPLVLLFSPFRLAVSLGFFVWPRLYEEKQREIDHLLGIAMGHVRQVLAQVQAKIPGAQKKSTKIE
jgi:hypothetical protein